MRSISDWPEGRSLSPTVVFRSIIADAVPRCTRVDGSMAKTKERVLCANSYPHRATPGKPGPHLSLATATTARNSSRVNGRRSRGARFLTVLTPSAGILQEVAIGPG
jgi:hypothetical protein